MIRGERVKGGSYERPGPSGGNPCQGDVFASRHGESTKAASGEVVSALLIAVPMSGQRIASRGEEIAKDLALHAPTESLALQRQPPLREKSRRFEVDPAARAPVH